MIQITQAPPGSIKVKERFSLAGTSSPSYVGKRLTIVVDNQFSTAGPTINQDGSWKFDFLFQQAGARRMRLEIAKEKAELTIQVVQPAPAPARPARLRFINLPPQIKTEELVTFRGEADGYSDGDQLVLRADQKYELARPKVQGGRWEAPVLFHQGGKRTIEILGSEQDRAQITVNVQTATLKVAARSAWTGQATPAELPSFKPKRITIHHTALVGAPPVNATSTQEVERMRLIWRSHVNGNGWSDIGYHYIIMPSGRIYAARSEQKRGAHDVINDGLGLAFDGVYSSATISPQQFQAAVELCTNLCKRFGFKDPAKPVATPTADFGTRNLPLICGHRDRVNTQCPGSSGGKTVRLEEIRQAVQARL